MLEVPPVDEVSAGDWVCPRCFGWGYHTNEVCCRQHAYTDGVVRGCRSSGCRRRRCGQRSLLQRRGGRLIKVALMPPSTRLSRGIKVDGYVWLSHWGFGGICLSLSVLDSCLHMRAALHTATNPRCRVCVWGGSWAARRADQCQSQFTARQLSCASSCVAILRRYACYPC